MTIETLFEDKSVKAKQKAATIGEWLKSGELPTDELLAFALSRRAADKAVCIEALEYATKKSPEIADESTLFFLTECLLESEPRVKWESAKVIGNIAGKFPTQLNEVVQNLLKNARHEGTVVRWATAYALSEILKLKNSLLNELLPKVEELYEKEADNGVKNKYLSGLKKVRKKS